MDTGMSLTIYLSKDLSLKSERTILWTGHRHVPENPGNRIMIEGKMHTVLDKYWDVGADGWVFIVC